MNTASRISEPVSVRNVPLPTPEQLPDDPETLKRMILELLATLHGERQDKEALRQRIDLLLRRLYGPKNERYDPNQLLLFGDAGCDTDNAVAAGTQSTPAAADADPSKPRSGRGRARPHGRGLIPEKLPREPVDHELSAAERICVCGQARIDIGVDQSEQLEWRPAAYVVLQHRVHKYLCPHCARRALDRDEAAATPAPAATPDMPLSSTAAEVTPATPDMPLSSTAAEVTPATPDMPLSSTAAEVTPATPAAAETLAPAHAVIVPTNTPVPAAGKPAGETPALVSAGPRPLGPALVSASKPAMPIDKGLPGPGLLAHIIVSKYADHLPLYRQESIAQRHGVCIPRSTSCDWMAACADLLRPVYDLMVAAVLQSAWLHTDDTRVKNLGHQPGETALARFWIYWGDRSQPYNVFDFTTNRKRDGPQTFLADYRGYLHADAFTGYDGLYVPNPVDGVTSIVEVACNAHARRKFYEARGSDAARAHQALAYYRQLYELERRAKENAFTDAQRRHMRQELAVPILTTFHDWLEKEKAQVLPKSPMAEALGYALNNWSALIRYTEAGFLEIDNNTAEREMKRIAIGRKNWLHVGSEKGGRTAAVLFSFTSTCQRLGVEPWAYLQEVLTRLPTTPPQALSNLLPDRWQAAQAAAAAEAPALHLPS